MIWGCGDVGARIQLSLKLMGWFVVGGKSAKALEGLANLFTDGGQTRLKRNTNFLIHSNLGDCTFWARDCPGKTSPGYGAESDQQEEHTLRRVRRPEEIDSPQTITGPFLFACTLDMELRWVRKLSRYMMGLYYLFRTQRV